MVMVGAFQDFVSKFQILDWADLVIFLSCIFGYRYFLSIMLKKQPDRLYLGKLQQYRKAWIVAHSGDQNSITVIQTLRNTIMSSSFLASTSILLIMGALNLMHTLTTHDNPEQLNFIAGSSVEVTVFKVMLVILILSYSFFNFTWYIREINNMGFILNIPKTKLDEIEGGDATPHLERMFLNSGIYFSLGMRGYYFLIPLLMWFFTPLLMAFSCLVIVLILLRRDLST